MKAVLCLVLLAALATTASARSRYDFPSSPETEVITIDAVGDIVAVEPLIRDFQAAHPGISIIYYDGLTNELFERLGQACGNGEAVADIVFSSSIDHMIKLANDGCASRQEQVGGTSTHSQASWQNEVFSFTAEPAVLVYNSQLLPPGMPVPKTRDEFVRILRQHGESLKGRVGTYDIEKSGIGYLFAYHDAQNSSVASRLLESLGRTQAALYCCSGALLQDIESGKLMFGYNVLGSYAYGRLKAGAKIGIVMFQDYTLTLGRAAFVPANAKNPRGGRKFLDYLRSVRGQSTIAEESFFFALNRQSPPEITVPEGFAASGAQRPIALSPALLAVVDRQNRSRLLAEWKRIFGQTGGGQ